jgi:hypothetical protein
MNTTGNNIGKSAIGQLVTRGFEDDPAVVAFREELVLHDRFQCSLDQVAERMQYAEQQSITAILGPTGSGKTALVTEFAYQFGKAMNAVPDAARTTLLCMELAAAEQGPFKWKDDFYIPALHALKEPCVTKKINIERLREQLASGDIKAPYAGHPKTIADFRNLFYGAMNRAKAIGALFDEANHLRRPDSKSGLFAQYDSLKSRSNACRAHFVLLGTIEIADIFKQSGPISKRVYPIWLSPYGPDGDEKKLFGSAVLSIVEKLPKALRIKFSIERKLDQLYDGSLGVYGLAHDWFDRALVRSLRLGKSVITWRDMEELALHPLQLSGIAADLIRYREVMLGANTYFQEQKASLFLPPGAAAAQGSGSATAAKPSPKPFERKPERDKVGT